MKSTVAPAQASPLPTRPPRLRISVETELIEIDASRPGHVPDRITTRSGKARLQMLLISPRGGVSLS